MLLLDGQIPLSSQVVLSLMRLSLQITLKSHENPEEKKTVTGTLLSLPATVYQQSK